jgi:predicted SAM-dependent methyltransferase
MKEHTKTLSERLRSGEFEYTLSAAQLVYYRMERRLGHFVLHRPPPVMDGPAFLNLGCGPHIFPGWVNADNYAFKRRLRERKFRPNWMLDISRPWNCADDHWDGIFSEHVLEHLTYSEAVSMLREGLRTLKPGGWIRISVPDLAIYAKYYVQGLRPVGLSDFPQPALGISFVAQMHLHNSVWDSALLAVVLTEIGFIEAGAVGFGFGADDRLIRDDPDKAPESLYVEARKP